MFSGASGRVDSISFPGNGTRKVDKGVVGDESVTKCRFEGFCRIR